MSKSASISHADATLPDPASKELPPLEQLLTQAATTWVYVGNTPFAWESEARVITD